MPAKNVPTQGWGLSDTFRIPIPIEDLQWGSSPPAPVTVAPFRGYAYTVGDDSYFQVPVPNDIQDNTDISIIAKWATNETYATNSGEVQFQVNFEVLDNSGTLAVGAGPNYSAQSGDLNLAAVQRAASEDTLGTLAEEYWSAGDLLGITLSRIAIRDGNNPSAQEPEIYEIWLSYTRFLLQGRTTISA